MRKACGLRLKQKFSSIDQLYYVQIQGINCAFLNEKINEFKFRLMKL